MNEKINQILNLLEQLEIKATTKNIAILADTYTLLCNINNQFNSSQEDKDES